MNDLRPALERVRLDFAPPPDSFERFGRLRRRRQLRKRFGAVSVALVVSSSGLWLAFAALRPHPTIRPETRASASSIAFVKGRGEATAIYFADQAGSDLTLATLGHGPAWSPDGRLFAYWTGDPQRSGTDAALRISSYDGTQDRLLVEPDVELPWAGAPSWSPEGNSIAFAGLGIYVIGSDGSGLRLITRHEESRCADLEPSWAPDGTLIAYAVRCEGGDEGIWTVRPDGSQRTQLIAPDELLVAMSHPTWSPDGSQIAFAGSRRDGEDFTWGLYVANADGTGSRLVTDEPGFPTMPTWSPDGSRIAFLDWRTERIMTIRSDGTGLQSLVGGATDCCPSWQPVSQSAARAATVSGFQPAEGWYTVLTRLDKEGSSPAIVWAANVPFASEESTTGWPSETIRDLPPDGIVITVIGPREYTGGESFPQVRLPLTVSQGFCSPDQYEGQPAPHVSKCLVDTMVGDRLLNVTLWFGANDPAEPMYAAADSELARLEVPIES